MGVGDGRRRPTVKDALWEKVRGTVIPEQSKHYLDAYLQGV
ncbi:MAG: hypothetical protein N2Z74_01660 [Syntrophales bacterium]|nr:hypothetical protein [Syntrophales bacterium]